MITSYDNKNKIIIIINTGYSKTIINITITFYDN